MKAYVINLDRDTERMAHVARQGAEHGIDWLRVPAVDKRNEEIVRRAGKARPGRLGFTMSAGAIACFESHRKAWKQVVDSGEPYGAVFEDDVVCAPGLAELLSKTDWIPVDCDIAKLETFLDKATIKTKPAAEFAGRRIVRLYGRHLGGCGYVISRSAAERLLSETRDFADPVDEILFNVQSMQFPPLTLYQVDPAPCIQAMLLGMDEREDHLKSTNDLNAKPQKKAALGPRKYVARKALRLAEKLLLLAKYRERRSIPFK